jgi:hypothetical protein
VSTYINLKSLTDYSLTRTRAAAVIETSVADRAYVFLINHQTAARNAAATPRPSIHQLSGDANFRDDARTEYYLTGPFGLFFEHRERECTHFFLLFTFIHHHIFFVLTLFFFAYRIIRFSSNTRPISHTTLHHCVFFFFIIIIIIIIEPCVVP